jgi:hypothetical protein
MEKHKLITMINYSSNFELEIEENDCLKGIIAYITNHILTKERKKATDIGLQTALLYITSQVSMLEPLFDEFVKYISLLFKETIREYENMQEFIYCLNLHKLDKALNSHYKLG